MKILLLISLFPVLLYATDLTCSKNGTIIFYSNGVNCIKGKAEEQAEAIHDILITGDYPAAIDSKKDILAVYNVYNESKSLMEDLLEAVVMKTSHLEGYRDAYESFYKVLHGKITLDQSTGQELAEEITAKESEYLESLASATERDVDKLTTKYEQALGNNCYDPDIDDGGWSEESEDCRYKVIGFSHSQGGLFVNEAYEQMNSSFAESKKRYFGAYQVATPASDISDKKGIYKTYINDGVIGLVADSLPANLFAPLTIIRPDTNSWFPDDFINHGLITTYLNNYEVDGLHPNEELRTAILAGFGEIALKLDGNCNEPPNIVIKDDSGNIITDDEPVRINYGDSISLNVIDSTNPDDPNGTYNTQMTAKWSYYEYTGVYSTAALPRLENPTVYEGQEVTIGGFEFTEDYKVTVTVTDVEGDISSRTFTVEVINEEPIFDAYFSCTGPCNTGEGSNYPATLYVISSVDNHDILINIGTSGSTYSPGDAYLSVQSASFGEERWACFRYLEGVESSWTVGVSAIDLGGLRTSIILDVPNCD